MISIPYNTSMQPVLTLINVISKKTKKTRKSSLFISHSQCLALIVGLRPDLQPLLDVWLSSYIIMEFLELRIVRQVNTTKRAHDI